MGDMKATARTFGYVERFAVTTGVVLIAVFVASVFMGPVIGVSLPWTWACLSLDSIGASRHLPDVGPTVLVTIFVLATILTLAAAARRTATAVVAAVWLLINVAWGWALWASMSGFGLGI